MAWGNAHGLDLAIQKRRKGRWLLVLGLALRENIIVGWGGRGAGWPTPLPPLCKSAWAFTGTGLGAKASCSNMRSSYQVQGLEQVRRYWFMAWRFTNKGWHLHRLGAAAGSGTKQKKSGEGLRLVIGLRHRSRLVHALAAGTARWLYSMLFW